MTKSFTYVLVITLLTMVSGIAQGQSSNENKAKAYFFSAQEYFEAKDYVNALNFLQSAENMLGKSNARIEALRAKTLHQKGDIEGAKRSLDRFFNYSPNASLTKEMAGYAREIEARYEADKSRLAAARRAKAEQDRKARAEAEERARKQAAAAEKARMEAEQRSMEIRKTRASMSVFTQPCQTSETCDELLNQVFLDEKRLVGAKSDYEADIETYYLRLRDLGAKIYAVQAKKCKIIPSDECLRAYALRFRETMLYTREQDRRGIAVAFEATSGTSCNGSSDFNCVIDNILIMFLEGCDRNHAPSCGNVLNDWKRIVRRGIRHSTSEAEVAKKTCDLSEKHYLREQKACWTYSRKQLTANGTWTSEAIQYAHRACDVGWKPSCYRLAADARRGKNKMKKSKKVAKSYFDKYCVLKKYDKKQCKKEYRKL